jgi:subtilisin family serine protease
LLRDAVEATRAAGILVVVSAGNAGPGCGSVADPPGIFAVSFTVGATDVNDGIAFFSSRGPVVVDGSNLLKPDVSAPGVGVRSAYPIDSYANLSGTSMAGPHAAGVAALIMSAFPDVRGKPDLLERLIKSNAIGLTSGQDCGSFAGAQVPNTVFGYGRIDALAAVHDYLFANQFE